MNLQEDDDEREQRERLDKRETENQEDKDSRTCARVTRQRLGGRSGRLTLTETAETGGQGHAQTGSQRNPLARRVATVAASCAKAGVASSIAANDINRYCSFFIVLLLPPSDTPPVGG